MADARVAGKRSAAKAVANLLAGAWRSLPPPMPATDLDEALALVARTNAAALVWWRLRETNFASLPAVEVLRDAYRFASLEAQVHEMRVKSLFGTLRSASIEPILIKGWDGARLYPRSALRPYEDIDLVVRPHETARAREAVRAAGWPESIVDFDHAEISVFDRVDWDGLYARSRTADLEGVEIRVLSAEDHLRAICIHGLKHCFSSPLWLCDVAVSVEAAGQDFDWARCFGSSRPQDQWIGCAIGLARELIACEVPPEAAKRMGPMPRWLTPVVLDTWARRALLGLDNRMAIRELLDNPAGALSVVARRWPNQLVVTLKRRAPLADDPRWLQRVREFAYLFEAERLVNALLRKEPARSTP